MGKIRRQKQKLHIASFKNKAEKVTKNTSELAPSPWLGDDLFAGLDININNLNTTLHDDVPSVKSSKSTKTTSVILPKKHKMKMRRQTLLRKIDAVKQMQKDLKVREKRKTTAIIGDTNPLHDALPSLESLLKNRPNIKQNIEPAKKKAIEKHNKRKKEMMQAMKIYKSVLNNKTFLKNPLETITQHVKLLVDQEKPKINK